jgi:geranylgeranyl pyrophosphate synthase
MVDMTALPSSAIAPRDPRGDEPRDGGHVALLEALMQAVPPALQDDALRAPLADFLTRPGKRIRGTLARLAHGLAGGTSAFEPGVAALVELLHAGSLIVDDIEDGAVMRRGRPALHHLYGTARALNAANWLYFAALRSIDTWRVPAPLRLRAHRRTVRTLLRCHEGQALDLTVRVTELAQQHVLRVVRDTTAGKSAALPELACWSGAVTAGADALRVRSLARFGRRLGTALQMYDDVTGFFDQARRPKCHEDLLESRPTWAWAWLASRLDPEAFQRLQARARGVASRELSPEDLTLAMQRALGQGMRSRPRRLVQRALSELSGALGPSTDLGVLRAEIERWERAYA